VARAAPVFGVRHRHAGTAAAAVAPTLTI